MKTCTACLASKPLTEFFKDSRKDGRYRAKCKSCLKAANDDWKARNPDTAGKASLRWQKENREAGRKAQAKWRAENLEQARKNEAAYRARNKPKTRAKFVAYKAAKIQATPSWANEEKIREFYFAADFLGLVTGEWYHVDHIVPLRSKTVCGLHTDQNLQVIPASDNLRKNNRHWPDMP
jgi:hypothetical protein